MGSRGAGSGREGRNGGRITELRDGNTVIDLSDTPLVYGGNDKALTGKAREAIEDFENTRYKNKVEFSTFVADDGSVIENNRGGRGSVSASLDARRTADAMSHNHPQPEGTIGGTFSQADVSNFSNFNQHTYRATAKEGTYSISKGRGFDGNGLAKAYETACNAMEREYKSEVKSLKSKVLSGSLTYDEATKQSRKATNKYLVDHHNWLLDNQSNYGYTYTLEKR